MKTDAQRGHNRKYWRANKERLNAKARDRYREVPEVRIRRNALRRAYLKANPEKRRAKDRNRRARKRLAEGTHTAADALAILALQNGACEICKKQLEGRGHLDHIIPLSRGGSNYPYNLQWLCEKCNLRKGAKDPRFQLIVLYHD